MGSWSKKVLIDKYFRDAKNLNYVSRAAFKLIEIQKKHRLIQRGRVFERGWREEAFGLGASVLDLGCVPGAWLQVACQELGPRKRNGTILGIDQQDLIMPNAYIDDRVHFLNADARELKMATLLGYAPEGFDVVLSDMLHFTSGHAALDVGRSLELTAVALRLAVGADDVLCGHDSTARQGDGVHRGVLKEGGHLVMKMFEGAGTNEFVQGARKHFKSISRMRPDAIRKTSREFYLICKTRMRQTDS